MSAKYGIRFSDRTAAEGLRLANHLRRLHVDLMLWCDGISPGRDHALRSPDGPGFSGLELIQHGAAGLELIVDREPFDAAVARYAVPTFQSLADADGG